MIDGFHLVVTDKDDLEKRLIANRRISISGVYNVDSGKREPYPIKGVTKGIKFRIEEDAIYLEGSVHKFYNELTTNVSQNYDDFSLSDLAKALLGLTVFFGDSILQGKLTMLEMGFNLQIEKNPTDFLIEDVILYRFSAPNKNDTHSGNGCTKGFRRADYRWKLYDKGAQYGLVNNVLRIEMRFTGRRVLERCNVYTLNDLLDIEKLMSLYTFLEEEFTHIMIIDNFGNYLNDSDLNFLKEITNPRHWIELNKLRKKKKVTPKIVANRKSKATQFLKKQNLTVLHNELQFMIKEKFEQLIAN